jgi:hypothetical protein
VSAPITSSFRFVVSCRRYDAFGRDNSSLGTVGTAHQERGHHSPTGECSMDRCAAMMSVGRVEGVTVDGSIPGNALVVDGMADGDVGAAP